jgi:hypothetical protein
MIIKDTYQGCPIEIFSNEKQTVVLYTEIRTNTVVIHDNLQNLIDNSTPIFECTIRDLCRLYLISESCGGVSELIERYRS